MSLIYFCRFMQNMRHGWKESVSDTFDVIIIVPDVHVGNSLDPLMDEVPFNLSYINSSSWRERLKTIKPLVGFGKMCKRERV